MPEQQLLQLVMRFIDKDVMLSAQLEYPVYSFVAHDSEELLRRHRWHQQYVNAFPTFLVHNASGLLARIDS